MINLSILKPVALASMLATGAAGTTVASGVLIGPAAESLRAQITGSAPLSAAPPAAVQDNGKGRRGPHADRGQPRSDQRLERGVRAMVQRLDLSDEQVARLRQILAESRTQGRAIGELPPGERGQARRELHRSTRAALEAVLTPAQKEAFEAMREEQAPETEVTEVSGAESQAAGGPSAERRAQAAERRGGPSAEHRGQAAERRAQALERRTAARAEQGQRPATAGPRRGPRAQQ